MQTQFTLVILKYPGDYANGYVPIHHSTGGRDSEEFGHFGYKPRLT